MRFLLYSHDGMGLGHVRRQLAIASALTKLHPSSQVLLATSIDEVGELGLPANVDTLKLPGLRKVANDRYAARRLAMGAGEIRALRAALLRTAVHAFRPDIVLVDKHPFGASGEFRPALEAARVCGARAVLGMRDILDEPMVVLREWEPLGIRDLLADYYDLVLVYGNQAVFDPIREYRFPPAVAARTRFCGYVVHDSAGQRDEHWIHASRNGGAQKERIVLATTGGGEDGFRILRSFIEASVDAPWKAMAVAGPLLEERAFRALESVAAQTGVTLHRFVPCLSSFFQAFDALVCMGGYNTLAEAMSTGTPTVCIPRVSPRAEQLLRSHAFESLGLIRPVHPAELTVERLRHEIGQALETPREKVLERAHRALTFNGTVRAARLLLELSPSNCGPRLPLGLQRWSQSSHSRAKMLRRSFKAKSTD